MATSKNPLLRYKTIDRCLRNRNHRWTIENLMTACNEALLEFGFSGICMASRRTIQNDLQFMRSEAGYSAPIIVVDRKYYTYEDPDFSIMKAPLHIGSEDIRQLNEAVGILSQLSGFATVEGLEDIISRLQEHAAYIQTQRKPVIYFEQNNRLQGLHYIPIIHQAILEQKVLSITYQSFRATKPHTYTFSPMVLKEFRNRWFLFGRHTDARILSNFALDRMLSVEIDENATYRTYPNFDPESYFEDIVGVTKNDEPVQKVRFLADPSEAPYILTKPIHKSQEVIGEQADGSKLFQICVIVNHELIRDLMGYGEGIVVLSPRSLVNQMRKKYVIGLSHYQTES